VVLQRGQTLEVLDQMNRSVGIDCNIGEPSCAVTANSAASEAMQAKKDVFVVESPAGVGAKASTFFRGVIGACRGRGGRGASAYGVGARFHAREDTVGESVDEAEDLVVPKARIKGDLGDEIGCGIGRVKSVKGVVFIGGARLAKQVVVRVAVRGERALRVLQGDGD